MPVPVNHVEVQAHYHQRRASLNGERDAVFARRKRHRLFLAGCAALFVFLGLSHAPMPQWVIALPAIAFVASLPAYLGLQNDLYRIARLQTFHDANLSRVDGTAIQSGHTGDEFQRASHLYGRDLDVVGPNSLFGLLATTRTGLGRRGLADLLLDDASLDEVLERQQCVRELAPLTELREQIALLGKYSAQDAAANVFDAWLEDTPPHFHPAIRWALAAISVVVLTLLLSGLLHGLEWSTVLRLLAVCFAAQTAIFVRVKSRVLPILRASRFASSMEIFTEGVALMLKHSFTSSRLVALQKKLREPYAAVRALRGIQNQFNVAEQLEKEYAVVLSILLSMGTQAAISIANWKHIYADPLRQWSRAWGEFEALCAVANYAFEHPANAFPELVPLARETQFHATALGHPLLPASSCVANDVALDGGNRFYLISGSNMAGKSTLLRAIGLNAVLAYAGAPVCAASLQLSLLRLGASIAVTDSLADGRSKFLAEVERLSVILDVSRQAPTLFLIDEIFSGTNSHDRAIAASAVLRDLIRNGAIGALSTHDLALTSLATTENHGTNVHMASPDADHPLAFDYLLKPGVNPTANALAIIRMMGIEPDEEETTL